MCDQEVESCGCVDEETECTGARIQGNEWIQQMLSVASGATWEKRLREWSVLQLSNRTARPQRICTGKCFESFIPVIGD